MKTLTHCLLLLFFGLTLQAQTFNYQTIVRNSSGNPQANTMVNLRFTILETETTGVLYRETQNRSTDQYGWLSVTVGQGTPVTGIFSNVNFSTKRFLLVECSNNGGTTYGEIGISPIHPSTAGTKGDKGDPGLQGPKGDTGLQGPKGDAGVAGPKGDTGLQGPKGDAGVAGSKGDTGDQGLQGVPGPKGDKGDPGDGSNAWSLTGNSGTNSSLNFIGTNDDKDIVIKRNNVQSGLIHSTSTFLGANTPNLSNSGIGNVAIGEKAMANHVNSAHNVAIGREALNKAKGYNNVSIGAFSLTNDTTGIENTAIGVLAMHNRRSGNANVAIGYEVLKENSLSGNVSIGYKSMNKSMGANNTAIGYLSLLNNKGGHSNVTLGAFTLTNDTMSANNIAIGYGSMFNKKHGNNNIAIGLEALWNNQSGSDNIVIGNHAGRNSQSSNKLYIENSSEDSTRALIYGDFAADSLLLNGKVVVRNMLGIKGSGNLSGISLAYDKMMKHADAGKIQYGGFGGSDHVLNIFGGGTSPTGNDRKLKIWSEGGTEFSGPIDIDGALRIRGGSPGVGKVLTSDADGNSSWQIPIDNSVTNEIQTLSLTGNQLTLSNGGGSITLPSSGGGSGTPSGPAGGDLSGTYPNPVVGSSAISTVKLADNAVNTSKLANNAVTSEKLSDGAVASAKIANNAVTIAKLPTGATATTFLRGDGTWASPTSPGLTLPYSGSHSSAPGGVFDIIQTGTGGPAITGIYGNIALGSGTPASGVYGTSDVANGVVGSSSTGPSYAGISGVGYNGAYGVRGLGVGTNSGGGYFSSAAGHALITEQGNVGIGTPTPSAKLDVNGQVKISGGAPGAGKVLTSDASGLATWQTPVSGGGGSFILPYSGTVAGTAGLDGLYITNTGVSRAARFRVDNTASTSPALLAETNGGYFAGDFFSNGTTGGAGIFEIANSSNPANTLEATTSGTGTAIKGRSALGNAGFFQIANTTSPAHSLMTTTNGTGFALHATSTNGTPKALFTAGRVQLTGISEGAGKVLTSDANGVATWQTPPAGGGGSLNGTGTIGSLTRWINSTTVGDASFTQDVEGNIGLGTIPQIAYKMKINSTIPSAFPLNLSANNVPGSALHFSLNDAVHTAEIKLQSAVTNIRTTSEKLALNARSASALPLLADHLAIKSNGQVTMGLFDPYSIDMLSIRGDVGLKNAAINFYKDDNTPAADIAVLHPDNKLHIHNIANNAGIEIISNGGSIDFATNGFGGSNNEMKIKDGKVTIGNTGVVAEPKLEILGQIRIAGGNPGAGKVLTSSSTGFASWETPAGFSLPISLAWSGSDNPFNLTSFGPSLAAKFEIVNSSSTANAVEMSTAGRNRAAKFDITNPTNTEATIGSATNGLGQAGWFEVSNPSNSNAAMVATTAGTTGTALKVSRTSATPGNALEINNGYIKVNGTNKTAFVHTVASNTVYSPISYPGANATDILSVTPVWNGTNFTAPWAIWWNPTQNRWEVFSQNLTTQIPSGMKFNIFVIKQ